VKKLPVVLLVLVVVLCACNRKDFVKKLVGTWKSDKYIIHNSGNSNTVDMTAGFKDSTNVNYQLVFNNNNVYNETYITYTFVKDSTIHVHLPLDTISIDTLTQTVTLKMDTLRFVDTTVTPYAGTGTWELINSEEDLELLGSGSDTSVRMFNILKLTSGNLNIQNGFKEYDLKK